MSVELALLRLTVNWPLLVGVSAAVASFAAMLTVALSLSRIVTVAARLAGTGSRVICGSPLVTPVSVTLTVSSASTITSSTMPLTSITADSCPARIVTLPLSAV